MKRPRDFVAATVLEEQLVTVGDASILRRSDGDVLAGVLGPGEQLSEVGTCVELVPARGRHLRRREGGTDALDALEPVARLLGMQRASMAGHLLHLVAARPPCLATQPKGRTVRADRDGIHDLDTTGARLALTDLAKALVAQVGDGKRTAVDGHEHEPLPGGAPRARTVRGSADVPLIEVPTLHETIGALQVSRALEHFGQRPRRLHRGRRRQFHQPPRAQHVTQRGAAEFFMCPGASCGAAPRGRVSHCSLLPGIGGAADPLRNLINAQII